MENTLSSPLSSSANNIVSIDSQSKQSMESIQNDYVNFLKFLNVSTPQVEKISLPDQKTLSQISNLNVASIFGSPGKLLSNLVGGSLDAGRFLGNMFPAKGTMGDPQRTTNIRPPQPEVEGSTLKFGGLRSVGIANAIFSGLDFSKDLSGSQPVNSPSGLSQNFAGEFLGSAINNSLIPVPGIGFVYSDVAGSFGMGGITPKASGEKTIEQIQQEKIKAQELAQKALVGGKGSFYDVIERFNLAVTNFENGIRDGLFGNVSQKTKKSEFGDWGQGETEYDQEFDYKEKGTQITPTGTGDEVFPLPSGNPRLNMTTGYMGGTFSSTRSGGRIHQGQDIGVDPNSPVLASRNGKVIDKYNNYGGHGDALIIKYDNGQQGLYGHINAQAKIGDEVKAGQKIGTVYDWGGNTHLHYMRKDINGQNIDPLPYLKSSRSGVPQVEPQKKESEKDLKNQSQFTRENADQSQSQMQRDRTITQTVEKIQQPVQNTQGMQQYISNVPQSNYVISAAQMNLPVSPQSIQYYTSYNQPNAGASVIMPIIMGGGGSPGVQQKPIFIPVGNGDSGSGTIIMPGPSEGEVVNSLMKTILLTNLLGT